MFEYIEDVMLKPARPYVKRPLTDTIVLHHFASDATPEAVHKYHISRGHAGIDYNIVVLLNGRAVWGRGLEYEGGHVLNGGTTAGLNRRSIGIACQGNFDERTMPAAQKATLFRVICDCLQAYPAIKTIVGHKDVTATACPGKHYPLAEAKDLLDERDTVKPKPPVASAPAQIYRVRKSWADAQSQIGAFKDLANAKATADSHKGYNVYDNAGKKVYPTSATTAEPVPAKTLKVGSKVKVKSGAKTYDGAKLASFVYQTTYEVMEIKGDRVVIGLKGVVTAAIKKANLILQ